MKEKYEEGNYFFFSILTHSPSCAYMIKTWKCWGVLLIPFYIYFFSKFYSHVFLCVREKCLLDVNENWHFFSRERIEKKIRIFHHPQLTITHFSHFLFSHTHFSRCIFSFPLKNNKTEKKLSLKFHSSFKKKNSTQQQLNWTWTFNLECCKVCSYLHNNNTNTDKNLMLILTGFVLTKNFISLRIFFPNFFFFAFFYFCSLSNECEVCWDVVNVGMSLKWNSTIFFHASAVELGVERSIFL